MHKEDIIETKFILICLFFLGISNLSLSQETIDLWSNGIPNYQETDQKETQDDGDILWIEKVQKPTLEIYLPTKRNATGSAILICPGGGYQGLAYDWEGTDIAKYLNANGIAAFVLKYRLPKSISSNADHNVPLLDAQRALRLIRHDAEKWGVSKDRIGIIGFSAGGHLASTVGTHFNIDKQARSNTIDTISARPDFMALIYPITTMKAAYTHLGSRNLLLGKNPDQELINLYSTELHVDKQTPPTFIVHATDDKDVPVMNSILFYQALLENDVHSEMHIYAQGGHGFALAVGQGHLQSWIDHLIEWVESLE